MTFRRAGQKLACDREGCGEFVRVGSNETLESARERAAFKGWTTRAPLVARLDFCPKHKR